MFVIETFVGPSQIHGNGVFSRENIIAGSVIWQFHPPFDQILSDSEVVNLPQIAKEYIEMYAYRCLDLDGKLVLSGDHARFLNHSDDPNTEERPFLSLARRSIAAGEEITCDYGAFCSDWTTSALSDAASFKSAKSPLLPHCNLYTRLKASSNGVGVFAIREIDKGTRLFKGDSGTAVPVPQNLVHEIPDLQIRQMYIDFCPKQDDYFIAPPDFNQLTMSWYMNHSSNANVLADENLQFSSSRVIRLNEELTIDYTTISDHASIQIAASGGLRGSLIY